MKLIVSIACSLLQIFIMPVGYGQSSSGRAAAARCPQLVIACPLETVEQDTQLRFSALVAGQDPEASLSYTWALTGAKINEGERQTPSITVDTAGLGGRRITATVAVSGLARECQSIASCAVYVARPSAPRRPANNRAPRADATETPRPVITEPRPAAVKETRPAVSNEARSRDARLDSKAARRLEVYGDLAFELEKVRLARLASELRAAPDSQGYLIVYGGRCATETQAEERAERAKEWLVNQHKIDASRIVVIDAGYRETTATEIYVGAIDATLPELTAATRPTDNSSCK
ncbi:MAG TPA: hypothetical protein VF544_13865 [Pyrinomonadaceae bacterium]|jgi:hypothetical protein